MQSALPPPFIFRIDEIRCDIAANDNRASWVPSLKSKDAKRVDIGKWWFCNGNQIQEAGVNEPPTGSVRYSTWSMFFLGGFGFWVMRGDAISPSPDETWQPLRFDHDPGDNYSSILTNAGQHGTLYCRPKGRGWPEMLLPDIYHGTRTPYAQYGGLKGELGILLGLIAFSFGRNDLASNLPNMFRQSRWQVHQREIDREDKRGVVVYVYTAPSNWAGGSTKTDLENLQNGTRCGKYYPGNPGPASI